MSVLINKENSALDIKLKSGHPTYDDCKIVLDKVFGRKSDND